MMRVRSVICIALLVCFVPTSCTSRSGIRLGKQGGGGGVATVAKGTEAKTLHHGGSGSLVALPGGCYNRPNVPLPCFKALLACTAAFFKKHAIPYRITDGTLLGQHRDGPWKGKFLPYDDDIDVSVDTKSWLSDDPKKCFQDRLMELFEADRRQGTLPGSCSADMWVEKCAVPQSPNLRLKTKSCTLCDRGPPAFQHLDIVDDAKVRLVEGRQRQDISYDTMWPSTSCVLEGVEVFCPKDTDKYLRQYYGENWKEPIYTGWDDSAKAWLPNKKVQDDAVKTDGGDATAAKPDWKAVLPPNQCSTAR